MLDNLLATVLPVYEAIDGIKLNWIGKFVRILIEGVGSVGLGVILFTLILKAIVTPLDAWSRISMRKNSLKMEVMRPQLEKLQKQYADDKQMYNQKMMQLYKKEGYSMFGACLPTIVSLVIFFIVLGAFNTYSQYKNFDNFSEMTAAYTAVTTDTSETGYVVKQDDGTYIANTQKLIDENLISEEDLGENQTMDDLAYDYVRNLARQASADRYYSLKQDFLWVKNIWVPDTAWSHPVLSFNKFKSNVSKSESVAGLEARYDEVTANLGKEKKQANGYFIFVVLSVGVTLLSQIVMNKGQKAQLELQSVDGQGKQTQKIMMIVMPIMIGVFAFMYTAAFSLYMVTNSLITLLTTLLINKLVEVRFNKKMEKERQEKLNQRHNYSERNHYKGNRR